MKRNNIILVLHLPPPYGGGEIQGEIIYDYFKNKKDYKFIVIQKSKGNKKKQGKLTFTNCVLSIPVVFQIFFFTLIYRPKKIFLSIPKDYISFIRTSFIIITMKLLRVKVYGELPGTSFMFMDKVNKFKNTTGRYIFKKIDSMRLLGNSIVDYGISMGFKNINVFDNGLDVPGEYRISDEIIFNEKLNMIYVGSLEEFKGLFNIIEALNLCKLNGMNFRFHFLGEWVKSEEKLKAENLANKYNLNSEIKFHGLQINHNKWEIYSECALLVHPTNWDGQPISIIEAMGLGLGVISTNVGAIPDTVNDGYNGIILKENNPQCLYEAIEKLYYDRGYLKMISQNNIETYNKRFRGDIFLQNFKKWINE